MSGPVTAAPRRWAAMASGVAAAGTYASGLVLAAGPGHAWSLGHGWLSRGGIDALAAGAAVAFGMSGLLLSRHRFTDGLSTVAGLLASLSDTGVPDMPFEPEPKVGRPMSPSEFVARVNRRRQEGETEDIATMLGSALACQLGDRLDPMRGLRPHVQCAIAVAAAHAHPDLMIKRAPDFRRDVARIWHDRHRDRVTEGMMPFVDDMLDRTSAWVAERTASHAYANTLLFRCFADALVDGTLPMAEMRWLKDVDRSAWYAVNSARRPTCLVEAAGTVAHHDAEREAGCPLPEPQVGKAVAALSRHMRRREDGGKA